MSIKKNIIILFVLFVVSNIIIAQNTDSSLINNGRCSIKINPLQLLYCGEARILFEKPVSQYAAFELIGSYFVNFDYSDYIITTDIIHSGPLFKGRNGFKAGISYRYYFGNKKKLYFNPLFFYKYMEYRNAGYNYALLWDYYDVRGKTHSDYDFIKNIYSLQIQYGIIVLKTKQFSIDFYGGIGIRYMQLLYRKLFIYPDMQIHYIHYEEDEDASRSFPVFLMGINLGYIIN